MFKKVLMTVATTLFITSSAMALPFVDMGIKLGMGDMQYSNDDSSIQRQLDDADNSLFAMGVAARFQLAMIQLEANALYWSETGAGDSSYKALSVPVIGRIDFAPIPLLKLAAGTGLEFQFPLAATGPADNDIKDSFQQSLYLPLSVAADFTLPAIGTLGVEARYGYELTSKFKTDGGTSGNYFLFFGTFLF